MLYPETVFNRQLLTPQSYRLGEGTATRLEIPGSLRASDVGNRLHADHCFETLRKALMCHGDLTPLLAIEDPESPIGRRADSNAHHRCRNFMKLQDWIRIGHCHERGFKERELRVLAGDIL